MKEFLAGNITWMFGAVVIAVFAFRAVRVLRKAKKIDSEGVETDAVVSKITENWDPDTAVSSFTTYVQYTDENGELRETPMAFTPGTEHSRGDRVRIRYIPGERELVREVRTDG